MRFFVKIWQTEYIAYLFLDIWDRADISVSHFSHADLTDFFRKNTNRFYRLYVKYA